jgi:hypothetical protein
MMAVPVVVEANTTKGIINGGYNAGGLFDELYTFARIVNNRLEAQVTVGTKASGALVGVMGLVKFNETNRMLVPVQSNNIVKGKMVGKMGTYTNFDLPANEAPYTYK